MSLTRTLVTLATTTLFLLPTFAHAALGANLVSNSSLEQGSTAPTGWVAIKDATANKITTTYPTVGVDGARAAKISATAYTSGDVFWLPPNTPVTTGKQYVFTGWSRSNKPLSIVATYLNASGGAVSYATLGTANGDASAAVWQKFTATTTIPAGVTQVRIQHVLRAVGMFEIDGYALQEVLPNSSTPTTTPSVPPATTTPSAPTSTPTTTPPTSPAPSANLITNGNFETAGSAGSPAGWSKNYWGRLTALFTYPVAGKSGKAAEVRVSGYRSGDAKWYVPSIPVSSTKMYRFSTSYQSDVSSSITVEYRYSNGTLEYQWVGDLGASASWAEHETMLSVPRGVTSLSVLHSISSNGFLRIDDVSLTPAAGSFAQGMVTFVFDDGLSTQFANARPILKNAGYKASYHLITGSVGDGAYYMTWEQALALRSEGNEIGAHTRTHEALAGLGAAALNNEVYGSRDDLVAHGITPKTFIYPYGSVDKPAKTAVAGAGMTGARGSYWGFNTPGSDRYALADVRLDQTSTLPQVQKYIDQALEDKRWLVFELHDVVQSGGDELSITPQFLQSVVDYLTQKQASVVTLENGLTKF